MAQYDCLVIGAGFAGAVTAGELARRLEVSERTIYRIPTASSSTSMGPTSFTPTTNGSLTI